VKIKTYQRFLKPNFKPFDPLELAKQTEEIVNGGIASGYAAG